MTSRSSFEPTLIISSRSLAASVVRSARESSFPELSAAMYTITVHCFLATDTLHQAETRTPRRTTSTLPVLLGRSVRVYLNRRTGKSASTQTCDGAPRPDSVRSHRPLSYH